MKYAINIRNELFYCIKTLMNIGIVFIITSIVLVGYNRTINITWIDLIINSFIGTRGFESGAMVTLVWIANKTFLLYLIINYFSTELYERYIFTLPRISSRTNWILIKVVHIFVLILLYNILCFLIVGLIGYLTLEHTYSIGSYTKEILNDIGYLSYSPTEIILHIFFLTVLSTLSTSILQLIIQLHTKRWIIGFSVLEILISASAFMTNINFSKYLIETNSIFIKHNTHSFTLSFSYSYNLMLILLFIYIVIKYKKYEI